MSFGDEIEPQRPTHVIFRCRRCGADALIEVPNTGIFVRESVEHRALHKVHDCDDGAQGVADLIGSGPGRAPVSQYEPESEDA